MPLTCQVNKVEMDLIYSDLVKENIISINSKKELFFDVYECIVDDKKIGRGLGIRSKSFT